MVEFSDAPDPGSAAIVNVAVGTGFAAAAGRAQGSRDGVLNAVAMAGYPSAALVRQVTELFPRFILRRS